MNLYDHLLSINEVPEELYACPACGANDVPGSMAKLEDSSLFSHDFVCSTCYFGALRVHEEEMEQALSGLDLSGIRADRNMKLRACDWTQGLDSPLSEAKRAEWAQYRQALRDFPDTLVDLVNIVWPTPPQ